MAVTRKAFGSMTGAPPSALAPLDERKKLIKGARRDLFKSSPKLGRVHLNAFFSEKKYHNFLLTKLENNAKVILIDKLCIAIKAREPASRLAPWVEAAPSLTKQPDSYR
jgi:hypothetical protein